VANTPASRKAKGRRFQQWVRDALLEAAIWLEEDDIRSTSMGASGEDLLLSPAARRIFPLSIECKNVERLNIWSALEQAEAHAKVYKATPALFFKRNRSEAYVAVPARFLIEALVNQARTSAAILEHVNNFED